MHIGGFYEVQEARKNLRQYCDLYVVRVLPDGSKQHDASEPGPAVRFGNSKPCVMVAALSAKSCYQSVKRGVSTVFLDCHKQCPLESVTSRESFKEFMISHEQALNINGQSASHKGCDIARMRQLVERVAEAELVVN